MTELSSLVFANCKAIFFIMLSVFSLIVLGGFILWFIVYAVSYFISRHRYMQAEKAFVQHLVDDGFKIIGVHRIEGHTHEDSGQE